MAVEDPVLYNKWWVYLRHMDSSASLIIPPSERQIHNAYMLRRGLKLQGYDDKAIAGAIGCAQVESGINPGCLQRPRILPHGGETLAECTTDYMNTYYRNPLQEGGGGYGAGIFQWDRWSDTAPYGNDLIAYSYRHDLVWYDGATQLDRLNFEYNHDSTYHFWRLNYGSELTWEVYKQIGTNRPNYDAGECANVWTSCYELSSTDPDGRQNRRDNAEYWYQYFIEHPVEPGNFRVFMLYNRYNKPRRLRRCHRT